MSPSRINEQPCVEITCDKCGDGDNSEYGCSFHHPSLQEAAKSVEACDWIVERDDVGIPVKFLCSECAEKLMDEAVD